MDYAFQIALKRMCNTNILFKDSFINSYDLVWMEWPHVKKPWTPAELDFIAKINPKTEIEMFTKHFKFSNVIKELLEY